jgi:hypothetical protein
MANNPLFARDGWGRDEHDRDESDTVDARDQPPAEAGSQLSPKLNDKPAHNSLVSRDAWRQNRDDDSPAAEPEAQPDADVGDQSDVDRDRSQSDEDGDSQGQAESAEAREPSPDHDTDATDTPDHEFVDTPDDPRDLDAYRRIRETDDLDAVADNSGYRREVVEVAKENLFIRQHDVAVGPGEVRHGNFTPLPGVAPLWERVASGADLSDKQQVQFWSLLAHEYVEAKLMEAGLPYLQAESDAWDDEGLPKVERDYPTAHTVAPLSLQSARKDLLRLWKELFGIPRGDLRVAEDLSNLDEVVRVAKEGLGL